MSIFEMIKLARTRDEVVPDYAELLRDRVLGVEIDWSLVNMAIIERWSVAGLRYIKQRAYRLAYPDADATEQTCPGEAACPHSECRAAGCRLERTG